MSIKCQQVTFTVANKALLKSISCEFSSQKVTAILGKNGAGKSTFIKCLSKQLSPSSGEIIFNGQLLHNLLLKDLAQTRAVLSQTSPIAFSMTVEDLVSLGLQIREGLSSQQKKTILTDLFIHFDLLNIKNQDLTNLSGGELQRAQLARIMAQIWPQKESKEEAFKHKWLLLDEWTTGLDLFHQQQFVTLFRDLVNQGLSIIMVVHDLNLAAQLADEFVLLKESELIKQGLAEEVLVPSLINEALALEVKVFHHADNKYPLFLK